MKITSKTWLAILLSASTTFGSWPALAAGDAPADVPEELPAVMVSEPGADIPEKVDIKQELLDGTLSAEDIVTVEPVAKQESASAGKDKTVSLHLETTDEKELPAEEEAQAEETSSTDSSTPIGIPYSELYADYLPDKDFRIDTEISPDATIIHSREDYYKTVYGEQKGSMIAKAPAASVLPSSVDNSQSKYFPAPGDQGQIGSCMCFADVYYQMTYEYNRAHDITTTPENTMSPKFVYNFLCGGDYGSGTNSSSIYPILQKFGVATLGTLPYDGNILTLSPSVEIYREAVNHKLKSYQLFDRIGTNDETLVTSPDDSDLIPIKTALANGDVLSYVTGIGGWRCGKLKSASGGVNDGFVGQEVILSEDHRVGDHGMTLVGYNDSIWCDVNDNGVVDSGEMGAFKIANSWGGGYANGGFNWIAYDCLNYKSVVVGGYNAPERDSVFTDVHRIDVMPVDYEPHLFARYTFNTFKREDPTLKIKANWANAEISERILPTIYTSKSTLNFSGTTGAEDVTLIFDVEYLMQKLNCPDFKEMDLDFLCYDFYQNDNGVTLKDFYIYDEKDPSFILRPTINYPYTMPYSQSDEGVQSFHLQTAVHNNAIIYYRGYKEPLIRYRVGNGAWSSASGTPMWYTLEEYGYLYKFVVPMKTDNQVTLYFMNQDGVVNNNNGQYYTAVKGNNYFVIPGVGDPFDFTITREMDQMGDEGVDAGCNDNAYCMPKGGYEPYCFRMEVYDLDKKQFVYLGEYGTPFKETFSQNANNGGYRYDDVGHFKTYVYGKDAAGTEVVKDYEVTVFDKPCEYTDFHRESTYADITCGETVTFVAKTFNDKLVPGQYYHYFYLMHEGRIILKKMVSPKSYSIATKRAILQIPWVAEYGGHYTAVVTRQTMDKEFASASMEFDVVDPDLSVSMQLSPQEQYAMGDRVKVSLSASGGSGSYQYFYSYIRYTEETAVVEELTDESSYTVTLPMEAGPYTIVGTVIDENGGKAYAQQEIWVNNPRITDVTFADSSLFTQKDYKVSVAGECISQNLLPENYQFLLIKNGQETPLTVGDDCKAIMNVQEAGTYQVEARICSGEAVLALAKKTIQVQANPTPPDPYPDKNVIYVAVISYIENEHSQSSYRLHQWNNSGAVGDVTLEDTGKTVTKSVGSSYWNGTPQTFRLYKAYIPKTATGFKFHIGDRWFGSDGQVSSSNCVYIFNYSGDKALYDKYSE